jgi:predicted MPP superfamily phosphohydrolase
LPRKCALECTHGGQIALTDGTPIVSAGGPLRINADPELVMLTLKFV